MDELSGGQFVLVNEAVNLGIAIYNMRQGEGICYKTLFRDETVGALAGFEVTTKATAALHGGDPSQFAHGLRLHLRYSR